MWASQAVLVVKNSPTNAGDIRNMGLIPGSGRSPGGRHGNPLQYSCLENPRDRGAWQATFHRVAKSQTRPKWPCMHRHKIFLPVAALPQWELNMKVAQLPGLQVPWWHQVCRNTVCLYRRNYGPIRVFLRASCSWRSEGLFGQPFSVAPPLQTLRGLPCLGSFFVFQHMRHIERPP